MPGAKAKSKQEIEVADAPEAAELEEEGDATHQRQEEPNFRTEAKIGNKRATHGSLVSPTRREEVRH